MRLYMFFSNFGQLGLRIPKSRPGRVKGPLKMGGKMCWIIPVTQLCTARWFCWNLIG